MFPLSAARRWPRILVLLVFGCIFSTLVISGMLHSSATSDEVAHLPAGYSYLLMNDYRMNTEHPPLIKDLAALPLLLRHPWPPADVLADATLQKRTQPIIQRSWEMARTAPAEAQWLFGHSFLYGVTPEALQRSGENHPLALDPRVVLQKKDFQNNADALMFLGRLPILGLSLVLGALIFLWAEQLFGLAGGTLALLFYGFDPNFIAHSGLVTTDVGASLFIFGSLFFLWRTCRQFTWINGSLTCLFFALTFVSKFSAVLLLPMFLLIGVWKVASAESWKTGNGGIIATRTRKTAAFTGLLLACLATTWIVIWSFYSFRYSAFAIRPTASVIVAANSPTLPIEQNVREAAATHFLKTAHPGRRIHQKDLDSVMGKAPIGLIGRLILFARDRRLLPEAYLNGFAFVQRGSGMRSSYLMGQISDFGFLNYFPCTFLFKTPLLTLIAIAAALVMAIWRPRSWLPYLLIPVVVYLGVSMATELNIGHRHLLPIYPFFFVLAGSLALVWRRWSPTIRLWTAISAVGLVAVSSSVVFAPVSRPAVIYPHYLTYFNELARGPRNGFNLLGDSNLDWGQGLPDLKTWLENRHISEPINLCYFGMADPRYYGFAHVKLPGGYALEPPIAEMQPPDFSKAVIPGYVAISATCLQGIYLSDQQLISWRNFLADARLVDVVGDSIYVFRVARPIPVR